MDNPITPEKLRRDIIGNDVLFETPYGRRNLFYADYTASGRGLYSIESTLLDIQKSYANTHTEDDYSGQFLTRLLHQAENRIKELVNAGPEGKLFSIGSGSTGALKKLQEIIGVSIPPVTRERVNHICSAVTGINGCLSHDAKYDRPVVFIGPYEHHTNELMWRESLADVVVVGLAPNGRIDLEDLNSKLSDSRFRDRTTYASFSAGSNITGVRSPVYDMARICHRNNTPIFFDFAAVAPYVEIDMNRDNDTYFDAIFFSPHKFLGGPGSSGILVLNSSLYREDLPPTTAGGGTVIYVGFDHHDFERDIETREKAGTPPILQTIKAALVLDLKARIGITTIEKLEKNHLSVFLKGLALIPNVQLIGPYFDDDHTPIVSFNIGHKDRILHPRFVTRLLNDLFGIQSRAGCSCAGPYGHLLLGISPSTSAKFRKFILEDFSGIKPGWVRINIHYTFTQEDIDFLLRAIAFVAEKGPLFLPLYTFEFSTAEWRHRDQKKNSPLFSVTSSFAPLTIDPEEIPAHRRLCLEEADKRAEELQKNDQPEYRVDAPELEKLKFFYYVSHRTD